MALTKKDLQLIRELIREEVKDDIIQFKDDILTEIAKVRDDITVVTGYRQLIANHDERLEVIEGTLDITPP